MMLFTSLIFRPKVQTTSPLQAAAKVLKQWWSCHRLNQVKFTCGTSCHKEASGQGTPSSPSSRDGLPCPSVGNLLPDPQTWLQWSPLGFVYVFTCRSGFPGGWVVKNLPARAGDAGVTGSIPGSGRAPWRRALQPTPKSHGQRSLAGYSPWSCRVRHDWATEHTCVHTHICKHMHAHTHVHMHTHTHTRSRDWQEASCSHPSFWHSVQPWLKKKKSFRKPLK